MSRLIVNDSTFPNRRRGVNISGCVALFAVAFGCCGQVHAQGEPAADFVKRLRAAEYFDLAITYLDRVDQYPGVDSDFITSVPLEKATTYIDAAVVARSATARDERFADAENELQKFLKEHADHARASEARSQLGKLRMFRASQFMIDDVDDAKRKKAQGLYQAAAGTFDSIIDDLRALSLIHI